jgi:lysophospholipase L1-like esterase
MEIRSDSRRIARLVIERLGLLCLGLTAALLIGEALVRVFNIGPRLMPIDSGLLRLSRNPRLRYEWRPGARDDGVQINGEGMRDLARAKEKQPGVLRIACLGDSICAGYSVASEASFPAQLEQLSNRVRACDDCVEVLNFGVPGYNLEQIVETLAARVLDFQPDLVIYGYCLNDPQPFSLELERLQSTLDAAGRSYLNGLWAESLRPWRRLRFMLLIRWLLSSKLDRAPSAASLPVSRLMDPQARAYDAGRLADYLRWLHEDAASSRAARANLDRMADLSRTRRVPVLVAIFPLLAALDHYPLADVQARLSSEIEERSLAVLDLTQSYQNLARREKGIPDVVRDPLHPGVAGHRLAAWALLRKLIEMKWIPAVDAAQWENVAAATKIDHACSAAIR